MIFPNPLEQAFLMKMMSCDWIMEIILLFLHLLQQFSLTHQFKDLNSSRSLKPYWQAKSMWAHILEMKSHIDKLGDLGVNVLRKLVVD